MVIVEEVEGGCEEEYKYTLGAEFVWTDKVLPRLHIAHEPALCVMGEFQARYCLELSELDLVV